MRVEVPPLAAAWPANLPPASELASVLGTTGFPWAREAAGSAMTWAQAAQARVVSRVQVQLDAALPPDMQGPSADLFSAAWQFGGARTREEMVDAALGTAGAIGTVMQNASAVSSVPVVGWVVGILVSLAEVGVSIWRAKKAEVEAAIPAVESLFYDESADEFWSRVLLDRMQSGDWTNLFFPYTTGDVQSFRVSGGRANRVWIIGEEETGFGICPGFSLLRTWGFDTTKPTQVLRNRNGGAVPDMNFTNVRPMTTTVAQQAWSRVETRSPQAFAVHADDIADAWSVWEQPLAAMAYPSNGEPDDSGYRARAVLRTFSMDVPAEFWSAPESTVAAYARWRAAAARKRQLSLLNTPMCAYVSGGAPAFQDPVVRARLGTRRGQLLQHAAVHGVELDSVPDVDYRQAVADAQRSVAFPLAGQPVTGNFEPGPDAPPGKAPPIFVPGAPDQPDGDAAGALILALLGWGIFG